MRHTPIPLAAAIALSACSTEPPLLASDPAPTWAQIEVTLAVSCGGAACHVRPANGAAGLPAAGLDLTPGRAFRSLLGDDCSGRDSGQDFGDRPIPRIVVRGDPDASYLVCKMDPECRSLAASTAHMPPLGGTRDPTILARVRAWIAAGALGPPDPEGDGCRGPPSFAGATSATRTGPDGVEVRWEPARDPRGDGVVGYRIYVGTAPGAVDFLRPRVDIAPPGDGGEAGSSATLTELRQGWRYVFVVRAYTADGGEDDNRVEVAIDLRDVEPPTFGGVASATRTDDGRIRVTWAAATDNVNPARLIRYVVLLSDRSRGYDVESPAAVTDPGALEATLAPLPGATTHFIAVRARDRAGNTDTNAFELELAARDETPPAFAGVTSVTASPGAITVAWDAATDDTTPSNEIEYLVYVSTTSGGALSSAPRLAPLGATSAAIGPLDPATTYFVVVRARDAAGNEDDNTNELSATTPAFVDTTAPTFAGATAADALALGARIRWDAARDDTAPASAIQYLVWQATTAGGAMLAGPPTYVTALGAESLDVRGLDAGTTYFFVVRARDPAGNTDTNTVEVNVAPRADTTAPTFAGLETVTAVSATVVSLTWSAASDDVALPASITYLVFAGSGAGPVATTTPVATVVGATTTLVGGLTPGVHSFVVRARDPAGNVETNTVSRSVTLVDATPPVFDGVVSSAPLSASSIQLSWAAGSDDVTPSSGLVYLVYRATSAGGETFAMPSATTPAGATSFTVGGLDAGTRYFFVVRARDAAGNIDSNTREASAATAMIGPVSFAADVQPILNADCAFAGCHGGGSAGGGLMLAPSVAYRALVGVRSVACMPQLLVAPGDADASFLYDKLLGGAAICPGGGTIMPRSRPMLPPTQIDVIRRWIAEGALDN